MGDGQLDHNILTLCIVDVEWIMIAFIMVVCCISGWGGQMFIVILVWEHFSWGRLGTM